MNKQLYDKQTNKQENESCPPFATQYLCKTLTFNETYNKNKEKTKDKYKTNIE